VTYYGASREAGFIVALDYYTENQFCKINYFGNENEKLTVNLKTKTYQERQPLHNSLKQSSSPGQI